jgi:hypothetical protein
MTTGAKRDGEGELDRVVVSVDEAFRLCDKGGVLDAVMEIGKERQRILVSMKEALERGDDAEALELARELTGLPTKRS